MKRVHAWTATAGALFLVGTPGRADDPPPLANRPNILLVVLDDVGLDKLSLYTPGAQAQTPYINQLAHEGIYFTHAYAQPLCSPARATIMTGRYAFKTGMFHNNGMLPSTEFGLAKLLKYGFAQPYACGAFGKWHLAWQWNPQPPVLRQFHYPFDWEHPTWGPNYGLEFDNFFGHMGNVGEEGDFYDSPSHHTDGHHFYWWSAFSGYGISPAPNYANEALIGNPGPPPYPDDDYSADLTRRAAVTWMNAQTAPFFAYVCFNSPHGPLQCPPQSLVSGATITEMNNSHYHTGDPPQPNDEFRVMNWMLESVDSEIKMLVQDLNDDKEQNTLVMIVGDNGTPPPLIASPPYVPGHGKGDVYEEGVRVPLIVRGPGVNVQYAYTACTGLVHTVDIFKTIAAMTGAAVSPWLNLDGVSFWQMICNPFAPSNRPTVFTQIGFPPNHPYPPSATAFPDDYLNWQNRGLRDDQYKLIRRWVKAQPGKLNPPTPPVAFSLTEEAYDLLADPIEAHDLFMQTSMPPAVLARIDALRTQMIALSGK